MAETNTQTKDIEKKDILILAVESSCDETAAAVIKNGREVLSNIIYSQIPLHKEYGGVVPEIASRKHIEKIIPVVERALSEAGIEASDADAFAVTYGPGLVGPLLVGVSFVKALSFALQKPLIGVNHIEGHICANYLEHSGLEPPYMGLVVSGGHSHLMIVEEWNRFRILGRTVDDAAGEVMDKIARALGLPYPGGPEIDRLAKEGNEDAVEFPKAHVNGSEYDFSFSGLKSAVLNYINSEKMAGREICRADIAASFQKAVTGVLCDHALDACEKYGYKKLAVAGGVAANSKLRSELEKRTADAGIDLFIPSPVYCTDNAAMIGCAAYYEMINGNTRDLSLNAVPRLKLGER